MTEPLFRVTDLEKHFVENTSILDRFLRRERERVRAVDGVSLDIHQGETLGLVGESGCGKSTVGETILGLQPSTDGRVQFDGSDLDNVDSKQFRKRAQAVFQDPFSSVDPRWTVGRIIREPLDAHQLGTRKERNEKVNELLERVGLSTDQFDRYPSELSGGQLQRVNIARAISINPDFILLDEPVSSLDVSVQAQVLNLLKDLQDEFGLTYLFITHDLGVIKQVSDRIAIMYLGKIVERGPTQTLLDSPQHPYTEALLESVPRPSPEEQTRSLSVPSGDVPSARNPPDGCRFHTRCPEAREVCRQREPPEFEVGADHDAACFRVAKDHEYWRSEELTTAD